MTDRKLPPPRWSHTGLRSRRIQIAWGPVAPTPPAPLCGLLGASAWSGKQLDRRRFLTVPAKIRRLAQPLGWNATFGEADKG